MRMRRLSAAILASAAIAIPAAPATAADYEYDVATEPIFVLDQADPKVAGSFYGWGWFREDGDWLDTYDSSADGKSVALIWELADGSRHGVCRNTSGDNKARGCNKNFVEGKTIRYRFGRCDGDTSPCNRPWHYEQLTDWKSRTT